MLIADIAQIILSIVLGMLALVGLGFGFLQSRRAKIVRDSKNNTLMESAHELAKTQVSGKSLESLTSDLNKLYPSTRSDDSESK